MISLLQAAAVATSLISLANTAAVPLPQESESKLVSRATSSCTAVDWWHTQGSGDECRDGAYYTVNIDVTYDAGHGCEPVRHGIDNAVKASGGWGGIWDYKCTASDKGATILNFSACQRHAKAINYGLQIMYPSIKGFNCPDY